jgi:hypothetical protein
MASRGMFFEKNSKKWLMLNRLLHNKNSQENDYIAYFRAYVGSLQKRTPSIFQ